ncbi:MAG TPA: BBP7 family outer membrane beta-barrel protein, partial [Gemmataceae bacterium]|nr:BBP7 family outer membrane beta-barrel protein [Gemmataceae bacterium]
MMTTVRLASLAGLLVSAGLVAAQGPAASRPAPPPASECRPADCACDCAAPAGPSGPRVWADADYLLWWVKNGPLPAPLVTTNADALGSIGALNETATRVLFGGSGGDLNYHQFSGGRVTVGGWLGRDERFGAEVSGFLLETRALSFQASSAGGDAPLVSVPFNATVPFTFNPAGETSLNAGGAPNTVGVSSTSRLWGAEANDLFRLIDRPRWQLTLLFGFRYLDLDERLGLNDTFSDAAGGGVLSVIDTFHTRNQFYGGQLGLRAGLRFGRLSVDVTGKCALGVDYEFSDINGSTVTTHGAFGFPTGVVPGGLFAEASNVGRHTDTPFTVVPEARLQVGYDLTRHLRAVIGYDFLYVSDVLRPGAQVDRNVNPTQSVLFGGTGGVLSGPPAPPGTTAHSDF